MANTYSQLFIHYVFAVQNRKCLITSEWETDLFKYINGIIEQQKHKLYIINGVPDHIHMLVSMNPTQAPSEFIYNVKRSSSLWINQNKFCNTKFKWQEGFGSFSVSMSQNKRVINYIERQKQHHKKETFIKEYKKILSAYEVDFNEEFIFHSVI
ncbi:MAG: IS200/IS605 family transposase [Bacteroidetes bacterium]|nr:IS200/IS605 family transposase [Bacteroidota bacterium]